MVIGPTIKQSAWTVEKYAHKQKSLPLLIHYHNRAHKNKKWAEKET